MPSVELRQLVVCALIATIVPFVHAQRQCLSAAYKRTEYLDAVALADRPSIVLHRLPWATSTIETYIIQSIISEVMGYSVSLFVDYDYSGATMVNKLANGEADFAADVWASSMPQQLAQQYTKQGLIVQQNQGYNPKTGLYVPTFLVQQYPDLYLGFWQVYSNPTTVTTVFNNTLHNFAAEKGWDGDWVCPDSFGCKNGTYFASKCNASAPNGLAPSSCVPVLMMGPWETGAWSFQVTENLGLYFVSVFVSSGNIDNLIQQYIAQQTPFLVFYSEPNPAIAKRKLTRIQFPEPYLDCTSQLQNVNPKGSVDCDTAPVQSLTLKSGSLKTKSYFVDQFLTNFKMTENDIVFLGLNTAGLAYGGTGTWEDAACAWVQNHTATWQAWLPSLSASVQAGNCPGVTSDNIDSFPADVRASYIKYCFKQYARNEALLVSIEVLCSVAIAGLTLIAAGVFYFRTHQVILASSPIFSIIMIVGAVGGQITIWLLAQHPTSAVCNSRIVVGHLSFVLLFWTLFAKTHRLSKIFKSSTIKIVRYSNKKLLAHLGVAIALISAYLIAWLAADPATPQQIYSGNSIYEECRHDSNLWNYAIFLVHALAVVWGVSLCVQIRDLPNDFNEAKYIAFSLYHVAIIAGVVVALVMFVLSDPNLIFAIESLAIFVLATSTILTLFVPKYLKIIGKLSLNEVDSTSGSNASSLGTPKNGTALGTPRTAKMSPQPVSSLGRPQSNSVDQAPSRLQQHSSSPRGLPAGSSNRRPAPSVMIPVTAADSKAEVLVSVVLGAEKTQAESNV